MWRLCTHNLWVIQDELIGGDHSWDTPAGLLHPSLWLWCILTLGPPRTLVLHSTPVTQRVVVTYAALTVSEVSTFFQRDPENLQKCRHSAYIMKEHTCTVTVWNTSSFPPFACFSYHPIIRLCEQSDTGCWAGSSLAVGGRTKNWLLFRTCAELIS